MSGPYFHLKVNMALTNTTSDTGIETSEYCYETPALLLPRHCLRHMELLTAKDFPFCLSFLRHLLRCLPCQYVYQRYLSATCLHISSCCLLILLHIKNWFVCHSHNVDNLLSPSLDPIDRDVISVSLNKMSYLTTFCRITTSVLHRQLRNGVVIHNLSGLPISSLRTSTSIKQWTYLLHLKLSKCHTLPQFIDLSA